MELGTTGESNCTRNSETTDKIRGTRAMNIEMDEFGQHQWMAPTRPVEMIDLGPYVATQASSQCQPQIFPNASEIIVFKTKKTAPASCGVTSCTKDSCSCDREAVAELIDKFCEGLHTMVKSRSKMCPHTIAKELMGDLNNVFFTWWEAETESTNLNSSERNDTVNQPSPRIGYESPPTSKTSSGDGPTNGLDSAKEAQEQDPQTQVTFWLNNSIYQEQPSDDDDVERNEETNLGRVPSTRLPEISCQTGATESESQINQLNGKSISSSAITLSLELDNPNTSTSTTPNVNMERRPSTTEKEVPELEGDAGIFCTNLSNNASIASAKRLSTITVTDEGTTDSLASSQSDMIIDEGLPARLSVRVENESHSSLENDPELNKGNMSAEKPTSAAGVGNVQISSTSSKSQAAAEVSASNNNETGEEHETTIIDDQRNPVLSSSSTKKMISAILGKVRAGPAAPASVKNKREVRKTKRVAKQIALQSVSIAAANLISQQQSSGSESGTPLKRRYEHGNVEVGSVSSSSPEITLLAKKPRALVSEDEYDTDQDTTAKSVGMEVDDNESGSEKEAINQLENTVDDSASVTTEEVHDTDEHNQIVNYGCSSPETVVSLDNVPLSHRLKSGKRISPVEPISIDHINDKNLTNRQISTNQKKSQDLVAKKSADEIFHELRDQKRKKASLFNISGSSGEGDDDILFLEEVISPSIGGIRTPLIRDNENLGTKPEPEPADKSRSPITATAIPIHITFPLRKSVSTPSEPQVASRSNLDKPIPTSDTPERVPLLRSVSAPATAETSKRTVVENRPREGFDVTNDFEPPAQAVPEVPGIEPPAPTTIPKRPAPPPPPVISKGSTVRDKRREIERKILEEQMSVRSKTTPSHPTSTNPSYSCRAEDITNKPQQQQSISGNNNSTNKETCNTSPLLSARRQMFDSNMFDPRNEAMEIRQKPVPKVTKDKVTESLSKKNNLPFPNPLLKKNNASTTAAKPAPPAVPKPSGTRISIAEYTNIRGLVPGGPALFNKGPQPYISPTAQQNTTPGQPKSNISFEGGEFRMAPKQPATVHNSSTLPGSRDRNSGDSSPRTESANRYNSEKERENFRESRDVEGLDRGSGSSRTTEVSSRKFGENYENGGGQSSSKLNENVSSSPKPTIPSDPRLRNRSLDENNIDVRRSSKSNESELSDPRLRKSTSISPDIENFVGGKSPNESEPRDPRLRHSSNSSTENHANRDERSLKPNDNENEIHDPRLRNRPPPPPAWNDGNRNSNSTSSGRGTWKRADGPKFRSDQIRVGADGHPHTSNDMMSPSQSPNDEGQRSSHEYDEEPEWSESGRQWGRDRENSGERRHSRERYSGDRDGDMDRRIPTQQYYDREDRGKRHYNGRGGRRGQGQFRGNYRGGHHQDFRQNHRNEEGRGGSRGRPFYKPRGGRRSFKAGYKKNYGGRSD